MPPQREWFETDYYQALNVPSKASDKEITKAYRKLARKHHPDSGGDEESFKKISAAYAVIGNPEKRKEYDETRRLAASGAYAGSSGGQGYASGPSSYNPNARSSEFSYDFRDFPGSPGAGSPGAGDPQQPADLSRFFRYIFGRNGAASGPGGPGPSGYGPGGTRPGNAPVKGVDIESRLSLPFRDAITGLTTTILLNENPAASSASNPGSPANPANPTDTAKPRQRRVKVRIPAGVKDGQRVRLPDKGGLGRNGGPRGDLYVVVKVTADPVFDRKGNHLTKSVPITYAQAALGADLRVRTFEGNIVTLKIPAGTQPGATFRVKGRGVKTNTSTGDLLVTTDIKVPETLSQAERKLIEQLAELEQKGASKNTSSKNANPKNAS